MSWSDPGPGMLGGVPEQAAGLDDDRAVQLVESIVYELNIDEQALGYGNGDDVGDGQTRGSIDNQLTHPDLREPIADIMADYIWDVNRAVDPVNASMPGGRGADFHDTHMIRLLAELGKDQATHGTIRQAEAVYAAANYDFYLSGEADLQPDNLRERIVATEQAAGQYGSVLGALDHGAISQDWYEQLEADNAHNDDVRNDFLVAGFVADQVVGNTAGRVPVAGDLANLFVDNVLGRAEQAAMLDNSGLVTYGIGETLSDGRQASADLAVATLYHSGQLEGLPPELVVDGTPKPMSQWSGSDYDAWQRYVDTSGRATVGDLAGDAANAYDDGVRRASETLNRDVFSN